MNDLTIAQAAINIANAAKILVKYAEMSPAAALKEAALQSVKTSHEASSRNGYYARETSSHTIEDLCFQGAVAKDILDGTVERPSVGNVRDFALTAVSA